MSLAVTSNRYGRFFAWARGAVASNRSLLFGTLIVGTMVLVGLLGPLLWSGDPLALGSGRFLPPSLTYPMGTDDLGRDVFARVILGARISLVVGGLSAIISIVVGCAVGATAGYFGGLLDEIVMRVVEIFQIIPRFLFAIVIVALFGTGLVKIVLVIGLLSWPPVARIVRAQFMVLRSEEFVLAAKMSGASTVRIIVRHILPNVGPIILVSAFLQMSSAILVESFLSFLGLGDPAAPSWGLLLQQAQLYLRSAWWMTVFPGLALFLTIFGLNLFGDGLNSGESAERGG